MELNLQQIRSVCLGAVRIEQQEDGFHFYRFTKEQEDLYQKRNEGYYLKTFASSGVRLRFKTDSQTLALKANLLRSSARTFFCFDLFVNGKLLDTLDNFSQVELPEEYAGVQLPQGQYEKTFSLGGGEKEVCLYFPWSTISVVQQVRLDQGASLIPVKPAKKLLAFGDSITHGADALHPSCKYISRLADHLDAQEFNKGIGGETFFPGLALTRDAFTPDLITVAYGTNDWSRCTHEQLESNCRAFFANLRSTYPDTPICAISPLWRKIWQTEKPAGPLSFVDTLEREIAQEIGNMRVINGFDLVPHDVHYFADFSLHPNDKGFTAYFDSLKPYF